MWRLILLFFIISTTLHAQKLLLVDESNNPIHGVFVVSVDGQRSASSESDGGINLNDFLESDELIFQHPNYTTVKRTVAYLKTIRKLRLKEKLIQVDEVVISANKWEQDQSEIPNKILTISPEEIAFSEPQTSADLLQRTGEVFVQRSQLGGGSPMLRGFAANRVLLVVDGVRMNNAIYRSGNLQNIINIDPNALESAEVVFGPGSVVYGSDALGGVMDFHFTTPKLKPQEELPWYGSTLLRYSSANNEKTGSAQIGYSKAKWGIWNSFTYSSFDDLMTGNKRTDEFPDFGKRERYVVRLSNEDVVVDNSDVNLQRFSGYDQWSNVTKIRFRPNNVFDFTYGFYFSNTSDIPRYDRLIQPGTVNEFRNAEWYYGPQQWQMHQLRAHMFAKSGIFDEARAVFAYQDYQESRNDRRFQSESLRSRREAVNVYSINLDFNKNIGTSHQLFYGMEFVLNDVDSRAYRRDVNDGSISPAETRYPDGGSSYQSEALYFSYRWKANSKLALNAGARLNFVGLKAETNDTLLAGIPFDELDIQNAALNGSLGLAYNYREQSKLRVNFATGFRAPNIDDVGKVFEGGNNIRVPNPDLEPEFTYNFEAGIEHQFGEVFRIDLTAFYTVLENAIVESTDVTFNGEDSLLFNGDLLKVEALVNTGSAYIYGASARLEWAINDRFLAQTSLSFSDGEDQNTGEPLRHTTPLFGRTSLLANIKKWKGELFFEYNAKREAEDIPSALIDDAPHLFTENGSLGWWTANVRIAYEILPYLDLSFGAENLLNKHYRPYSSGISAPGRNFVISVRTNF
jgi:hemoglobin/transferrin/lactoferrin receptor protein